MISGTVRFTEPRTSVYTVGPNQARTKAQHLGVNIHNRLCTQILHTAAFHKSLQLQHHHQPFLINITIYISPLRIQRVRLGSQGFQMYSFQKSHLDCHTPSRATAQSGTWLPVPRPLPTWPAGASGYMLTAYKTNLGEVNNSNHNYLPISQFKKKY